MSKNPIVDQEFVVKQVIAPLVEEAGDENLVPTLPAPPMMEARAPISPDGMKQRRLIQEAMTAYISASAGLTDEVRNATVTILSASHERAKSAALELSESDADLKKEGSAGHRPTLSVFYHRSASLLRGMAEDSLGIPEETDRELLLLIADTRESIAWTMVKCFDKAEAAMANARMRSIKLVEDRLRPTTVSKFFS